MHQVLLVCVLFFMLFGIICVNYLKGTFNECEGDDFGNLSPDVVSVLESPVLFSALPNAMQAFFKYGCTLCRAPLVSSVESPSPDVALGV
jgi:hypothetical protein